MVKEKLVDDEIKKLLLRYPKAFEIFQATVNNNQWRKLTEMANVVAVGRWRYNDHGPVHSKIVTRNSIKIAEILRNKGIKMSYEIEKKGRFEDSLAILILSSMFHDVGNCITREFHEIFSVILSRNIIRDILENFYDIKEIIEMESYIFEGIAGHMGRFKPTSLEGRIVAIADGLDMEEGRARIPYKLGKPDIHKFSALAIEKVRILSGSRKPLKIEIHMSESAGTFQIEEVLMPKIKGTEFEDYIEIYAIIRGKEVIRYL